MWRSSMEKRGALDGDMQPSQKKGYVNLHVLIYIYIHMVVGQYVFIMEWPFLFFAEQKNFVIYLSRPHRGSWS